MSIISKLFKREKKKYRIGGIEDFMTLIRVYFQSSMAVNLGISNLSVLPELRTFKQTLKVATVNNRLGVGERAKSRKMLIDIYGLNENFFKEIDHSIKQVCRNVNDTQGYGAMFQAFTQDLMMVLANELNLKMRLPSFLFRMIRTALKQKVHDILTQQNWKDEGTRKACAGIRQYAHRLGYSEEWIFEYANCILTLAKKEPAASNDNN